MTPRGLDHHKGNYPVKSNEWRIEKKYSKQKPILFYLIKKYFFLEYDIAKMAEHEVKMRI